MRWKRNAKPDLRAALLQQIQASGGLDVVRVNDTGGEALTHTTEVHASESQPAEVVRLLIAQLGRPQAERPGCWTWSARSRSRHLRRTSEVIVTDIAIDDSRGRHTSPSGTTYCAPTGSHTFAVITTTVVYR